MQVSPTPLVKLDRVAISAKFETALSTIELLLERVAKAGERQMLFVMLDELKYLHKTEESRYDASITHTYAVTHTSAP